MQAGGLHTSYPVTHNIPALAISQMSMTPTLKEHVSCMHIYPLQPHCSHVKPNNSHRLRAGVVHGMLGAFNWWQQEMLYKSTQLLEGAELSKRPTGRDTRCSKPSVHPVANLSISQLTITHTCTQWENCSSCWAEGRRVSNEKLGLLNCVWEWRYMRVGWKSNI